MARGFAKYLCAPISHQNAHIATSHRGLRTAAKYAQRDGTLFSCGGFALVVRDVAHFGYLEKTGDMAQVGPYFISHRGIVVRQHVETLGCRRVEPKKRT